jgi:nucleoside-diphosphate-sugar epimerase
MKILITGTDGFIGSNLKEYFLSRNFRATSTVFIREAKAGEIRLDITNPEDFRNLPDAGYDAIIHSAGVVDQCLPRKTIFAINAEGTKNLLGWAKSRGCGHFIQISSVAVYGLKVMGENRTESGTKRYEGPFALPYMRSKAKAEKYVEDSCIPYTILRLPAVFGQNDSYISSAIIPSIKKGEFFFCGNKNRLFSTLYIKNLGPIIERIIELGPLNDCFNCTDNETTWSEFVEEYARKMDIKFKAKKKSILSIITHLSDKKFLLPLVNSRFGAHYPNDKLQKLIGIYSKFPWQNGVRDAIKSLSKA